MIDKTIREATVEDIPALAQLGEATFVETFGQESPAEDVANYLAEAFSLEKVTAEMAEPGATFYLSFVGDELAGYLKLNTDDSQTEPEGPDSLEVQRIYFLKKFQGLGLGTDFFRLVDEKTKEAGKKRIWLGVWEHNQKALHFYEKKGFKPFSEHVFVVGSDRQRDIMMEKKV
ncbi:GNAT family N-acetyltransferase [Fructobacillus durionis]|uniref:Ribosomal protein S18 acetylase RimI n=1 Tax=Fructobacillus durionis TaxID=283737 RepID=A0A1I1GSQ1_9LACO|nr:N-acetyltransferase [Fructobacillus durionis]SFC14526.1 Ribosomal protein S18 acetylase RimI [Fructobacillus durionis]